MAAFGSMLVNDSTALSYSPTLERGETYLIDNSDGMHSKLDMQTNNVRTYFFTSKPTLYSAKNIFRNFSTDLKEYQYLKYNIRLNKGSNGFVNWNSTNDVNVSEFYLIKGTLDFENMKGGYDFTYEAKRVSTNCTYDVSIETDEMYYFVWKTTNFTDFVNFSVKLEKFEYDVSTAEYSLAEPIKMPLPDAMKYIVIVNEGTNNNKVMFTLIDGVEQDDITRTILIIGAILGAVLVVVFIIIVMRYDKKNKGMVYTDGSGQLDGTGQPANIPIYPNQFGQEQFQQPQQPQQQGLYQPIGDMIDICPFCGSSLDYATKEAYRAGKAFCRSCGKSLR